MKRTIAALCASALLIAGTGSALARATSTPTKIIVVGATEGPPGLLGFYGYLETSKKCRADRTVKLFLHFAAGYRLVDEDKSSRSGNFGASGDTTGADAAKIRVTRTNVGRKGHPHICEADTITMA